MKKIMDNKVLKFIVSLIRIVVWIIAIMVVILILVQRVFNNKIALIISFICSSLIIWMFLTHS